MGNKISKVTQIHNDSSDWVIVEKKIDPKPNVSNFKYECCSISHNQKFCQKCGEMSRDENGNIVPHSTKDVEHSKQIRSKVVMEKSRKYHHERLNLLYDTKFESVMKTVENLQIMRVENDCHYAIYEDIQSNGLTLQGLSLQTLICKKCGDFKIVYNNYESFENSNVRCICPETDSDYDSDYSDGYYDDGDDYYDDGDDYSDYCDNNDYYNNYNNEELIHEDDLPRLIHEDDLPRLIHEDDLQRLIQNVNNSDIDDIECTSKYGSFPQVKRIDDKIIPISTTIRIRGEKDRLIQHIDEYN